MTWNIVKRLANQNRVNCLSGVIGQSDLLSFYNTEKHVLWAQRILGNKQDKTLFSLGHSTEILYLVSRQTSQHNLRGLSTQLFLCTLG